MKDKQVSIPKGKDSMEWKLPPKIKIYEALGCIGDNRIHVKDDEAGVLSSSRGKEYTVKYDSQKKAIMSNDNGSYWGGYLGYPSISFLMVKGIIKYNPHFADSLRDVPWKDINVKFRNNFEKTEAFVLEILQDRGYEPKRVGEEVALIVEQLKSLHLEKLGPRVKPPSGY